MRQDKKLCATVHSFFVLYDEFHGQKYFFSRRKIKLVRYFFAPNYYSKIFKFDLDK